MLLVLLLAITFMPVASQAAIAPYFVLINETKLPFSDETMPLISGSDIFVPVSVLAGLQVWAVGSDDMDFVRLFRDTRYIDFHTGIGQTRTIDQDGVVLNWPAARRLGRRFYVPLRQVSDFFGFSFRIVDVPRDIIPERQMQVLRIISGSEINDRTAVGMNRAAIRESYLEHFATPPPPPPQPPETGGETPPTPPIEEEPSPPDYSEVTIHLSFYDISAGSAEWILDLLELQTVSGFHACFFVSFDDILENPGLIRRISGTGHTLGIWLQEGTIEEYHNISALLFEAAKVRTVIVSANEAQEAAREVAAAHGLIFWESAESLVDYSISTMAAITAMFPRESGARRNLLFSCSEGSVSMLPGVYSYLRTNLFTVERITEMVVPTGRST